MDAPHVPTVLVGARKLRTLMLRLRRKEYGVSVFARMNRLRHRNHLTVRTVVPDRQTRFDQSFWRRGEVCLTCRTDWPVPRK